MHDELKKQYSSISDAEDGLSQVLLTAHATTAAGQQQLNQIQTKIIDAVNNPSMSIDTPAGQRSFLTFLHSQAGAINDLLTSASLIADDQAKTTRALSTLYAVDGSSTGTPLPDTPPPPTADPPATTDPASPGGKSAPSDAELGPPQPMLDPSLADVLGADPVEMGQDPLSSLASEIPAGGLGGSQLDGLGGTPLDGLGGLAGAIAQLAASASQPGDHLSDHDHSPDTADKTADNTHPSDDANGTAHSGPTDTTDPVANGASDADKQPGHSDCVPAAGGPPPPMAPASPPTDTVQLPDGSSANARTPAAAQAVRAYLGGDTIDAAYANNNLTLPPPGTPVTNPVDPGELACGDVGIFGDHYVVALSSVKALANGQVVALGSVASSPDFLGWIDPTATAAGAHPTPSAPASAPPPTPDAPADVTPQVPAG